MNKDVECAQATEDRRSLLECVEAMVPVLDRYVRALRNVNDTEALELTNLLSDARYAIDSAKSDEIAEKFKELERLQNDDCDDVRYHYSVKPSYQCCPVCKGTGLVSRPPHIAGDQTTWTSSSTGPWPCKTCKGEGALFCSGEKIANLRGEIYTGEV